CGGFTAQGAGVAPQGARAPCQATALERGPAGRAEVGGPPGAGAGRVPPQAPRAASDPADGVGDADRRGDGEDRPGADEAGGDGPATRPPVRPQARGAEPRPGAAGPA